MFRSQLQWNRSTGDLSGVNFYNVRITGPQQILITADDTEILSTADGRDTLTTVDDSTIICDDLLCRFTTRVLIPGSYVIQVTAVDGATNESDPVSTADFSAGPRSLVQDLTVLQPVDPETLVAAVNTDTPTFQWIQPKKLPDPADDIRGGIGTYLIRTADTVATGVPITDPRFSVQCFNKDNVLSGLDAKDCIEDIDAGHRIQLTATADDGTHTLSVSVVPIGAAALDPATLTYTVDTTPPGGPVLVNPPNLPARKAFLKTPTPRFTWVKSSGDPFLYRLLVTSGDIDNGPFDVDVDIVHPNIQAQVTTADALQDAVYQWRVIAGDRALNTASSVTRSFTVDTVAPGVPLLAAPADELLIGTGEVPFEWRAESGDADVFDFRLQVVVSGDDFNTGPFVVDEVTPLEVTRFTGDLVDDIYQWRVLSRDRAFNTADSAVRTFTVDFTAPLLPVPSAPIGLISDSTPLFQWDRSPSNDIASYRLLVVRSGDDPIVDVLITGDPPAIQFQVVSGDDLPGGLPDATYQWKLIAGDRALNTSSSVTAVFTVDTPPPATPTELTEVTVAIERIEIFTWKRSEDIVPPTGTGGDQSGVVSYNVVVTGPQPERGTVAQSTCNLGATGDRCQFVTPELIPANYNIAVIAVDLAGNESAPVTADFRAGPLVVVQNLRVESPLFVDVDPRAADLEVLGATVNTGEPVFRWTRSEVLPDVPPGLEATAIVDYEVVITGDPATGFSLPATGAAFVSFADSSIFITECFGENNVFLGFGKDCTQAVNTGDEIRIQIVPNLDPPIPDGTHVLAVRVIGTGDIPPFDLVKISFTVDRTAPDVGTPRKEADGQPVPDDDDTPEFSWVVVDVHSEEVVFQRVHIESETFIDITVPDFPALNLPLDDIFTGDVRTFEWAKATDDISTERGLTYTLEVDFVTGDFSEPVIRRFGITGDAVEAQFTLPQGVSLASGDFVWRVRATDRAGNIGDFSEARRFDLGIDKGPPGQPTLIVPALEIVIDDTTPEFAWTQVTDDISGVKSYTLHIATADITTPFFSKVGIPQPANTADDVAVELTLLEALPFDKFTWRVEAFDRALNSRFSIPSTFTIVADNTPPGRPVLIEPANASTSTDTTPEFRWSAVTDLPAGKEVKYRLEIALAPTGDFNNRVFTADDIEVPLLILPSENALATGDFTWRVRAKDIAGNVGIFSVPFTFTVTADKTAPLRPTLLSPSTGDVLEDPTPAFSWRQVADDSGVTYTIEIAHAGVVSGDEIFTGDPPQTGGLIQTGDFDNPVFTGDVADQPVTGDVIQFELPDENALDTGDFFWRVRAVDGAGNTGDFSVAFIFVITADGTAPVSPTLISPRNGSSGSNTTPIFTWTRVEDLSGVILYTLEVTTGGLTATGTFVNPVFATGGFISPVFTADVPDVPVTADRVRFTLATADLATGDYIWHVRAVDTKGNTGDFNPPFFFTLTTTADAPALSLVPVLISPVSGDVIDDPTPEFAWRTVRGDLSPVTYSPNPPKDGLGDSP